MRLRALLAELDAPSVVGDVEVEIQGLAYDSREVLPGFLFAALRGAVHDGRAFAADAVARGAVAVVADRGVGPLPGVAVIRVADARRALAQMSAALAGHPSRELSVIGVTGTNGKGATTYLIEAILRGAGRTCGIIGTMGVIVGGEVLPSTRTTPEAPDLQRTLRAMAEHGQRYAAVEVASHALAQERSTGVRFNVGVFTNLTRDHLDFHRSMEAYRAAKARLFALLPDDGWAVLNADDPASAVMRAVTRARTMTYGVRRPAEVQGREIRLRLNGSSFLVETPQGTMPIELQLAGAFNVSNALGAIAVGLIHGVPLAAIAEALAAMPGIPGRFESVDAGQPFAVVVDYAHTPDGLDNVLRAAREITDGRLIAVFGCGGDRDRTKRPEMGRIAVSWADHVIVTSDNPRTEAPSAIIDDIRPGIGVGAAEQSGEDGRRAQRVEYDADRRSAIFAAVGAASDGDLVLIAGKGHEAYQEIGGIRHPFDDREVVREALRAAGWDRPGPTGPGGSLSQGVGGQCT